MDSVADAERDYEPQASSVSDYYDDDDDDERPRRDPTSTAAIYGVKGCD